MNLEISIHHFLLYSKKPEDMFHAFVNNYKLPVAYPITNFGFYKSGMLSLDDCFLEVLYYPQETPAPNSNNSNARFVGIALTSNKNPVDTLQFLKTKQINCSEILEENIVNKNGEIVNIAKIILLNDLTTDFRIFFVFYPNEISQNLNNNLNKVQAPKFTQCIFETPEVSKLILFINKVNETIFTEDTLVMSNQKIILKNNENSSSNITSFRIKTAWTEIDLMYDESLW